jgi:basic membrane lipoprotein Med (substrate-binding protein (PBP1-ABC) superfamily)
MQRFALMEQLGRSLAKNMYCSGANIIYHVVGWTGIGLLMKAGRYWMIGIYMD